MDYFETVKDMKFELAAKLQTNNLLNLVNILDYSPYRPPTVVDNARSRGDSKKNSSTNGNKKNAVRNLVSGVLPEGDFLSRVEGSIARESNTSLGGNNGEEIRSKKRVDFSL